MSRWLGVVAAHGGVSMTRKKEMKQPTKEGMYDRKQKRRHGGSPIQQELVATWLMMRKLWN